LKTKFAREKCTVLLSLNYSVGLGMDRIEVSHSDKSGDLPLG